MAKKDFNDEDGVWRTIGGRKVFIRKGQNLADAMIESGKFKGQKNKPGMRESYREEIPKIKEERKQAKSEEQRLKYESNLLGNRYFNAKTDNDRHYIGQNWNNADVWALEERDKVENYDKMLDKENTKTKQAQKSKEFDKEHGKAEKLREQYRKEKDFKEEDKLYDKMSNLGPRTDENANDIDNAKQEWLNKYRENTNKYSQKERRERREKETDPYDNPESEESQRLQDIQRRYDEYLQETEGRGASYGEIAYVDNLRGKDLDDFEKELDDYFYEENEESDLDRVKRIQNQLNGKKNLTKEEKDWQKQLADTQKKLENGVSREDIIKELDEKASESTNNGWESMGGFGSYKKKNNDGTESYIQSAKDVNGNTKYMRTDVDKQGYKVQNTYDSLEQAKTGKENKSTNNKEQALDQLKKAFDKFDDVDYEHYYKGPGEKQQNELNKEIEKIVQDNNISREDWEKVYKPPFSYGIDLDYNDYAKTPKTTNDTMNQAIREKASKKDDFDEEEYNKRFYTSGGYQDADRLMKSWLNQSKSTKESTPNYDSYSADEQDILDGFGEDYGYDDDNKLKNLKEQIDYMRVPGHSIRQTAKEYVEGGSGTSLMYVQDAKDYLDERGIKYDKDDPYSTYADIMAEMIEKLYNDASNSSMNNTIRKQANMKKEWKLYLKDHPDSKMSLSEYKKMKK